MGFYEKNTPVNRHILEFFAKKVDLTHGDKNLNSTLCCTGYRQQDKAKTGPQGGLAGAMLHLD
jgi:hypothetical protein